MPLTDAAFRRCAKTGKIKYDSEREARTAAKNMKRKGHGKFNAFACVHGKHWHIGHDKYWKRKQRNKAK